MKPLTVAELCDIMGGRSVGVAPDLLLTSISTDSRQPISANTLFFALVGPHFDAHNFLPPFSQSIVAVVSQTPSFDCSYTFSGDSYQCREYPHILVEDTLEALHRLAAYHRRQFEGEVIAITGSHGKTTTKELLVSMLSDRYRVYKSPGSYNSQVGVALSLIQLIDISEKESVIKKEKVAIIEVGISCLGEMERLIPIVEPDYALLTSVGSAHLNGFAHSLDVIASEKMKLLSAAKCGVFYPDTVDFEKFRYLQEGEEGVFHVKHFSGHCSREKKEGKVKLFIGLDKESREGKSLAVEIFECDNDERINLKEVVNAEIPSPARYNIVNATAAVAVAREFGISSEAIKVAIESFEAAPMRLEIHTTPSGVVILNDAYISDPTSARQAIDTLVHYGRGRRTTAIFGEMAQLGETHVVEHASLGAYASQAGVKRIFVVGEKGRAILDGALGAGHSGDELHFFESVEELKETLPNYLLRDDILLFKGRRAMALEEVASTLFEPVAPTRLEIRTNALRANISAVRQQVGGEVKIMAIVKSFAYGSDATKICQILTRQNVDWFGVAYPDEAIPIRESAIHSKILVMNVLAEEAEKFVKYNLTALVSDVETARALSRVSEGRSAPIEIHLEIDTGMHRLGMLTDDIVEITSKINELSGVRITGVMTHFAAADDPSEDDYTRAQIAQFREGVRVIEGIVGRRLVRHAANTAATWRFPEAYFDMVRLGIGLYGIHPSVVVAERATSYDVLRFVTKVLRVHEVGPNETVGYNRRWVARERATIATIAVGYNDGFHRYMANGGVVLIRGKRCPVVGSVCMDTTMVDVTACDAGESDDRRVSVGDEVVLFGVQYEGGVCAEISVEEVAALGNTISYEILTGISSRVRRIFIENDLGEQ